MISYNIIYYVIKGKRPVRRRCKQPPAARLVRCPCARRYLRKYCCFVVSLSFFVYLVFTHFVFNYGL